MVRPNHVKQSGKNKDLMKYDETRPMAGRVPKNKRK